MGESNNTTFYNIPLYNIRIRLDMVVILKMSSDLYYVQFDLVRICNCIFIAIIKNHCKMAARKPNSNFPVFEIFIKIKCRF